MADLSGYGIDHVKEGIYISGARATMLGSKLREAEITRVLKLYDDIPFFPKDFTVFENVLEDGEPVPDGMLQRGADFVVEQVEAGHKVLVVCGAGISRSSTFVLAALLERGNDLRDAYTVLRENHPIAEPHPDMWKSLLAHYDVPYTFEDIWKWQRD